MWKIAIACGLLAAGCVDAPEEGSELGTQEQGVVNGDILDPSTEIAKSMVWLPGCSGVALDWEWILTAEHCPALAPGTSIYGLGTPVRHMVVRETMKHPSLDVALVRVFLNDTPVPTLRLWNRPVSELLGSRLFCAGQGGNVAEGEGGGGTWRWAPLTVSGGTTDDYEVAANGLGQHLWFGDSGGPCTKYIDGAYHVTGITSLVGTVSGTQVALTPAVTAWVEDIRQRSRLFFFNATLRNAATAAIERGGRYTSGSSYGGFGDWTDVTMLRTGSVLFYNRDTGAAAVGRVNKDGAFVSQSSFTLPAGLTAIVPAGRDRVFLYKRWTGEGWVMSEYSPAEISEPISGFRTDWTHIRGTAEGALLFYSRTSRVGATGVIDANRNYVWGSTLGGMGDWTEIAPVGERGMFFYNGNTGLGHTSNLSAAGVYMSGSPVYGVPKLSTLVGTRNGTLLFIDNVGTGRFARISIRGYLPTGTITGFAPWSHVVAE